MENPLIDLKGLSKPITKLVEVVAQGAGNLYAPIGTVRQAKADAKARVILAKADDEVRSIEGRAHSRVEYREAVRQENLEAITVEAARVLPEAVSADAVETDWVLQFFDCCQDVCDSAIQSLWGRILAGEVTSPGSYSKRTLQFLKTLDKWEAEKFSELCAFTITHGEGWHALIGSEGLYAEIRESLGKNDFIGHFISIGLITPDISMPPASAVSGMKLMYFEDAYELEGPPETPKGKLPEFDFVNIQNFSVIGNQLASIAGAKPIAGFMERLRERLQTESKVTLKKL
ncbi:MAG: DUF2806 domain-containing protein [Zoogloeaceae bacterium]|nr:DUF2806 domain-containing protein [Zoogloeaceae bacterium]